MQTRFFLGDIDPLSDREIGVICSTSQLARDGHIIEPGGIDLSSFRQNPIVLWSHDPDAPVGVAVAVGVQDGALAARIEFAPLGASPTADQVCSLAKAGVVRGVSIGFDPTDFRPLDPRDPRGGQRILACELLEISLCSVPVDTGAGVVARGYGGRERIATNFRALPPVSRATIERAFARMPLRAGGAIMSHAGHVWALQQMEREKEKEFSKEARRAELERLGRGS